MHSDLSTAQVVAFAVLCLGTVAPLALSVWLASRR